MKILICDGGAKSQKDCKYDFVLNWNSCNENSKIYSIPNTIENNATLFRAQYLEWVSSLGQEKNHGKSIIDSMNVRKDFSLWWMSLIFEKSKWKSPGLYQVFQLFAMDFILGKIDSINTIYIDLDDANVCEAIKQWSLERDIVCNRVSSIQKLASYLFKLKSASSYFLHFFNAIVWLLYYSATRWSAKTINTVVKPHGGKNSICIVSYFFNLDKKSINNNIFVTKYWEGLHELIPDLKKKINWVHLFVKSEECPNISKTKSMIQSFNTSSDSHMLIDQHISFSLVMKTLKDYLRIVFIGFKMSSVQKHFIITNKGVNFWHVLSHDWKSSIYGKSAITNCLYLNIFEKIFKEIPRQNKGLYLLENQSWERAMLYAWHKNNHGYIIGTAHTVVSYWNLRLFCGTNDKVSSMVLPDAIALNGAAAVNTYNNIKSPIKKTVKVEALRYMYLESIYKESEVINLDKIKMLILTDYDKNIVNRQIKLLEEFIGLSDTKVQVLIKSHPLCSIKKSDYDGFDFEVTSLPIRELSNFFDVAFTSNATAAAVDVYLTGKKTLIMHDCSSFNLSPLRGYEGVSFIKSAREMIECISELNFTKNVSIDQDFFYTDAKLPRWSRLLKNVSNK